MRFGRRKSGEYSGTSGFIDTPKKGHYRVKVRLLDDTELSHDFPKKAKGQIVLDHVCWTLDLAEKDYFSLSFQNEQEEKQWIDPLKTLRKQLQRPYYLEFCVKFYVVDPAKLREELTRYLFFLQIKRDLLIGKLVAPPRIAAEIFSLVLQSELGDYDPSVHDRGYVSEFRFLPTQSLELEEEIGEIHKARLIGQTPATAELSFLHKVKWLDMYGMELHHVMGMDKASLQLGLSPTGITLLQNKAKVGSFMWGRITNISFRKKKFSIRVESREPGQPETTFNFLLKTAGSCKQLWKSAIEQHSFFRLTEASKSKSKRLSFLQRGSKYRFSGRTQWQAEKDSNEHRQEPKFKRTPSRRYARRSSFCGQSGIRWNQQDLMYMRSTSLLTRSDGTRTSINQGLQPNARTVSASQGNLAVRSQPGQIQSNELPRTKAVAALDRPGSNDRNSELSGPNLTTQAVGDTVAVQSRPSPHEELEHDIQRLGQRPVDQSSSYHSDYPSSRRQYGSLMSVQSGSSDQHGILPTRTMSNQSVQRGGHMPALQRQVPAHVSTENIPTDDEPPPAYTPYPTVLPSGSSGQRQIPSYLANCPPPPSIPAPSPPLRQSAHSVARAVSPFPQAASSSPRATSPLPGATSPLPPTNETRTGQEVSQMLQQQRTKSGRGSEVHNEGYQAKTSLQVRPQMRESERQQRKGETAQMGVREEPVISEQQSDRRDEHTDQREMESIQMTRNDELRRPLPTDTVIMVEHGSFSNQVEAASGDFTEEENSDQVPPVSVQGEPQVKEIVVGPEQREAGSPITSTPVRGQPKPVCLSKDQLPADQNETEPSREKGVNGVPLGSDETGNGSKDQLSADQNETEPSREKGVNGVPLGSVETGNGSANSLACDEDTRPAVPMVKLDCFPPPPMPVFDYDDDLPPPPSPVCLSRSTEYLLLHTDADSESSSPLVLTPFASPVPLRKSLLAVHFPNQTEGAFSRPSSLLSLPPLPDNYGQDGCDTWLELELPPPPDHVVSRSTSPQSDQSQDILQVDVQQSLLLTSETWESSAKNNPLVEEFPGRADVGKTPLSLAVQEEEFRKEATPVEVSRLVARVRNSLSREGQDGIRSALLGEASEGTDDGNPVRNPYPDIEVPSSATVHVVMSPGSDSGDCRVDEGTCRSGYSSDQHDYHGPYEVSKSYSRSSLPGHRYSSAIQACLDRDYALRQGYMSDDNLRDVYSSLDDSPASTISREFRYGKKERERLMEQADLFASRLRNWTSSPQVRYTARPLHAASSSNAHRRYVMTPTHTGPDKLAYLPVARSSSCDILEFDSPHRGYGRKRRPVAEPLSTRPGLQHTVL